MKKLLIGLLLMTTIVVHGQSKWDGFFKPVTYDAPALITRDIGEPVNLWLFRPVVSFTAIQFTWNPLNKRFDNAAFTSIGMGIGYQHYIESKGEPYNDFGGGILMLANTTTTMEQAASISIAGVFNFLDFVSMGAGYDMGREVFFLLTGVSYSF
jgi:hypothetical protein